MMEGLEARVDALARRRVAAVLERLAGADLPPGLSAEHSGDTIVISGRGLVPGLAFDSRLAGIALAAGDA